MSEIKYDDEIAPDLLEIAKRCKELKMPFLAVVEYEPGSRGRTFAGNGPENYDMALMNLAIEVGGNVDEFVFAAARYVQDRGLPHTSVILQQIGVLPNPEHR